MDRKDLFKHKAHNVEQIRDKKRTELKELRREARHKALNAKRVRCLSATVQEQKEITEEQMIKNATSLIKKEGKPLTYLKVLYTGAAQGSALISAALSVESILSTLVGLLSGDDAELQYSSARVLCHISASTHDHAESVMKAAGSYLITYLDCNNNKLKDECAWALGNIAGDSEANRKTLREMGAVIPLINLLDCSDLKVVQSAAFALSNLARGEHSMEHDNTSDLVNAGIIPKLVQHLDSAMDKRALVYEVLWVLTYIAASGRHSSSFTESGVVNKLDELLMSDSLEKDSDIQLSTPLLRCLGNLCCGESEMCEHVLDDGKILPYLAALLKSEHHHIKKECLWLLSNITSFEKVTDLVVKNELIEPIVELLSGAFDLKKEAAYCICNISNHSVDKLNETLKVNALPSMIPLLHSTESEVVAMTLCYVELILKQVDQGSKLIEEADGLTELERLEYSSDEPLRTHTNHILTTYLYKEETEEGDGSKQVEKKEEAEQTPDSTTTTKT